MWRGCVHGGGNDFILKGHVPGMKYGTVFIRSNDSASRILASTDLEHYDFRMEGKLPEPGAYVLQVNDVKTVVLLEGREFVAEFSESRGANLKALKGSSAQECLVRYDSYLWERVQKWQEENRSTEDLFSINVIDKQKQLRFEWTCEFISENPDNVASAFIAVKGMGGDYDKGMRMYGLLSERVRQLEIGKTLMKALARVENSALGKRFPALEVCMPEGDSIVLKDWEGCVTVVDFWASWCGPCREELQYLKKLYKELEGKNVKFVSVSLDNSSKAWIRANDEEKLEWLSVRNLDGFNRKKGICKDLDIKGIPFIVVLDENGAIAGKSLRQDSLRAKLLDLLK